MERNIVYRDASQPISKRVEDLLSRMTIEEKLAQLGSLWVYELNEDMRFSSEKAGRLMAEGMGQITRIGGASSMDAVECAKAANTIQKFLKEKTRLGIPAIVHEECCSGYMARGATIFPQAIGIASTWNPLKAEEMGEVIRTQIRSAGGHQGLSPVLDISRDARWGRMEETFGEDPYLVSSIGTSYIKGLQGDDLRNGIAATGKHYVGYGCPEGGMNWAPAHIPQRELHEVYLHIFEAAVKEGGLASVMNGYHELDGIPCGASKYLLTDVLRGKWDFNGIVVSDYGAVSMLEYYHKLAADKVEAALMALDAGIDVELPSTDSYGAPLKEALQRGLVTEEVIDTAVARILSMKFRLGLFENPYVDVDKVTEVFNTTSQKEIAYDIAPETMVLLKNDKGLLPLKKDIGSLAVIGPNADNIRNMIGDYSYPCHIETLLEMMNHTDMLGVETPVPEKLELEGIFSSFLSILGAVREKVSDKTKIRYAKGCDILGDSREGFMEAIDAARDCDAVILVVGGKSGLLEDCTSGEARDRADLDLPGVQEELAEAICGMGKPVVAVLVNGSPMSIRRISENAGAVLETWLPGQEGSRAVADVLFGDYNPGGKLPVSIPRSVGQVPVFYGHKKSGGRSHWRGDYVELSTKPLYPFGYGLSYTSFEYEGLKLDKEEAEACQTVNISFDVSNSGSCKGDEIIQLYVHDPSASVTRPVKELKGFRRLSLEPGEKRTVVFTLFVNQLGFMDTDMRFVVEPGVIQVLAGSSSEDIRLSGEFKIVGARREIEKEKVFFSFANVI